MRRGLRWLVGCAVGSIIGCGGAANTDESSGAVTTTGIAGETSSGGNGTSVGASGNAGIAGETSSGGNGTSVGASGNAGSTGGSTNGAAGSGGASAALPSVIDCDTPPLGAGSCWLEDICREGADAFHAAVVNSICIPGLGFEPSEEPCTDFQLLGRCYDSSVSEWSHRYYQRTGPTAAELEAQCLSTSGNVWCTGPLGVPDATSRECRRACDEARPDYTEEPECLDADSCFSACLDAVAAENGCAECVTARIDWPAGGCNDFECQCPPATF